MNDYYLLLLLLRAISFALEGDELDSGEVAAVLRGITEDAEMREKMSDLLDELGQQIRGETIHVQR